MKGIIKFALTEIKLILRDKSFYLWALVLPVAFIFVFSGLGGGDNGERVKSGLYLLNKDKKEDSNLFINYLKNESLMIYEDKREGTKRQLTIPNGFTDKIKAGEKVNLKFRIFDNSIDKAGFQVKISIYRAMFKFIAERKSGLKNPKEFFNIKSSWQGRADKIPSGFLHQIPATIIIFLLFNLLIYGGIKVVELRERGMLKRFAVTPFGKTGIWSASFITNIFVGIIVIFMILLSSSVLFGVSFEGSSIFAVILVLAVYGSSLSALGIFIGSIFKRTESVVGVAVLLANLLAALGGCWWPIEVAPDFMKKIAFFIPTRWAMKASDKLLFFKYPVSSVLNNILLLIVFTVIFAALSIKFFNIQD